MLKTFTPEYYMSHRGCYEPEKMQQLVESNPHATIQDFLNWPISIKDKFYFVRRYTDLTDRQKQELALMCAKVSLKIYEAKYPEDKRIANGIDAIGKFLNSEISREAFDEARSEIRAARCAAYAADAAAYADAAAAAAYAADDAAYAAAAAAAAYAAYAAAAADAAYAYAAAAAAYADAAAGQKSHTEQLLDALKTFCEAAI